MNQAELDRAVARATGETVTTIKRLGILTGRSGRQSRCRFRNRTAPMSSTGTNWPRLAPSRQAPTRGACRFPRDRGQVTAATVSRFVLMHNFQFTQQEYRNMKILFINNDGAGFG